MSEAFLANQFAPQTLKNKIFICNGFGKKYKSIDLEKLMEDLNKKT